MSSIGIKLSVLALLLMGAFCGGYKAADYHLTARATADALKRAQDAEKASAEAIAAYNHLAGELSAANDKHTNELRSAQNETNHLRDRIAAGAGSLRVSATCPPSPGLNAGSHVDSGTWAELDPAARLAYFALRDGIDRASAQLAACQDELRLRTEGGNKSP